MDRKHFIKTMAVLPFTGLVMKINGMHSMLSSFPETDPMPVLFLGHGSPMNAIDENEFVFGFRTTARTIPLPKAILCISAHWETKGTFVTAMEKPKTIHDFGGFPKELYEVQYPASGSPLLANEVKNTVTTYPVGLNDTRGLDHGCWSVVKHLYPDANVPVVQMSLDFSQTMGYHYELARELASLRRKGILIIGSGNMVHNLRMAAWNRLDDIGYAYDWALEANEKMKSLILQRNHKPLIQYQSLGQAFIMAIPTPEHFLPLLYVLALQEKDEQAAFFNDKAVAGSLTMTSVKIGV